MIIDYLAGAATATVCIIVGHVLHMRYLDRKLLPPPAKPAPKLPVPPATGGQA